MQILTDETVRNTLTRGSVSMTSPRLSRLQRSCADRNGGACGRPWCLVRDPGSAGWVFDGAVILEPTLQTRRKGQQHGVLQFSLVSAWFSVLPVCKGTGSISFPTFAQGALTFPESAAVSSLRDVTCGSRCVESKGAADSTGVELTYLAHLWSRGSKASEHCARRT